MNITWDVFLTPSEKNLYREIQRAYFQNVNNNIAIQIITYLVCVFTFRHQVPWTEHLFFALIVFMVSVGLYLHSKTGDGVKVWRDAKVSASLPIILFYILLMWVLWQIYFFRLGGYIENSKFTILVAMMLVGALHIALLGYLQRVYLVLIAFNIGLALWVIYRHNSSFHTLELFQVIVMGAFHYTLFPLHSHRILNNLRVKARNYELLQASKQKNQELENISFAQSRYLSAVSHDLRQPLYALTLMSHELERKNTDPVIEQAILRVNQAIESLTGFFNSMLNLSRLDSQGLTPKICEFPINQLFIRLKTEFEVAAQNKGLQLSIHPSHYWTQSDPDMLYSILSNLISNAIRYTEKGEIRVHAHSSGGKTLSISVSDSGIGIAQEDISKIFDEYTRLDYAKQRVTGGVGLGLSISLRMAKLLKHDIRVRSRVGLGSVFRVLIPKYQVQQSDNQPNLSLADKDILAHKVVIIIEDNAMIAQALSDLLTSWHMRPHTVTSSDDFIHLLPQLEQVDLVLSDYHLGKSNETGLTLLQLAARRMPGYKFRQLLITGDTTEELMARAQQLGITLMHKPLRPDQLRATLIALLRQEN